ncbi:MAG TPA: Fpg/Nei family DNA glycosylase [Candidatus Corynebacterium gallistercoris]|uniref:DNA-(apurinic or apyrimidinic site) lyase n=1 Tax=Candidatus Corynebacterium gallistercoris TaxID=2838530 RepID=A0A9D1RWU9_9CORY|nr:Fpg/Nei family DNA glycosylase [Candidatus Corynebacterium gallistercoris]
MPEGDSVLRLSERMQWMVGRTVTHTDIRVSRFATVTLDGQVVRRVWPYGKHLFIHIGDTILHTHLKMEGHWAVHQAGQRWRRPGYTARIVLRFTPQHAGGPEIEAVGHELGFVRLFPAREYGQVTGHLGPDILDPEWDREEALRRVLARPERALGAALLDQTNVAGIGNEYRAEIMFLIGRHPAVKVGVAGPGTVARSLDVARRVMWANRWVVPRNFTGDKRPGQQTFVFGRAGKPCRRCGSPIAKGPLGGVDAGGDPYLDAAELERIIWWCPRCQGEG